MVKLILGEMPEKVKPDQKRNPGEKPLTTTDERRTQPQQELQKQGEELEVFMGRKGRGSLLKATRGDIAKA